MDDGRAEHGSAASEPTSRLPPLRLFLAASLVTLGAPFNYGWQLTMVSPAESALQNFVNRSVVSHYAKYLDRKDTEAIWGMIVALFFVGSVPGAIFIQKIADNFGRKKGIVMCNLAVGLCCALDAAAAKFINSIELFAFCRFFIGFWTIAGIGIGAIFLTECSPKYCRGGIGFSTGLMIQFGAILGAIIAMPQFWGNDSDWWLLFLVGTILQVVLCLAMLKLRESPSFLLFRGKISEAEESVKFYMNAKNGTELARIMDEIRADAQSNERTVGMIAIWRDQKGRSTRRGLVIGMVLGVCMSFCGISVIDAYTVGILQNTMGFSLLDASLAYVGIEGFGMIAEILSTFFVDRLGRRPLLFASFAVMFGTNLCIAIIMGINHLYRSVFLDIALVAMITLFCAALCWGLLPLYYFVTAEMVSQSGRSATQAWARLADSVSRSLVLAAYLPMRNTIGDGQAYALFFLPILGIAGIYLYFALPETKNRNLIEIEAEIERMNANLMANPFKRRHKIGQKL